MELNQYLTNEPETGVEQGISEAESLGLPSLSDYLGVNHDEETNQAASGGTRHSATHEATQEAAASEGESETVPASGDELGIDGVLEESENDLLNSWLRLFGADDDASDTESAESAAGTRLDASEETEENESAFSFFWDDTPSVDKPRAEQKAAQEASSVELPSAIKDALASVLGDTGADPAPQLGNEDLLQLLQVHQKLQQEAELLKQAAMPLVRMGFQITEQDIQDVAELARQRRVPIDIAMKAWGYEYLLRRELGVPVGRPANRAGLPQFPMGIPPVIQEPAENGQSLRFADYLHRLVGM